jgi:hypothetical protein
VSDDATSNPDAGAPLETPHDGQAPDAGQLDLKRQVRSTTPKDRLVDSKRRVGPLSLTGKPPEPPKQNRLIDRLKRALSPRGAPDSAAARMGDAMKAPDQARERTSVGKKSAPGEHTAMPFRGDF